MKYTEPALTIEEQLTLLKKNNLVVHNEDAVGSMLSAIGYFRLNMYMKYFKSGGIFRDNTTIEEVEALYQFDKTLRFNLFKAISDIEVAVRALLNNTLACKYGPHWIMNFAVFKQDYHTEHSELVAAITRYCTNKPEEHFIKQYKRQYTDPDLPPTLSQNAVITPCTSPHYLHHKIASLTVHSLAPLPPNIFSPPEKIKTP